MKASEFINIYTTAAIDGRTKKSRPTIEDIKDTYNTQYFFIPRLRCKDGFSISVQVHKGAYCASENGIREFGFLWKEVEWGFPSELITGEGFNAEEEETTQTIGSYVDIDLIDALIESHGGLDVQSTLRTKFKIDS